MPSLTERRVLHIEQRQGVTEGRASHKAGFRRRHGFTGLAKSRVLDMKEGRVSQKAGSHI